MLVKCGLPGHQPTMLMLSRQLKRTSALIANPSNIQNTAYSTHTPPPPTRAGELEALQECTIGLGAGDQREMLSRMVSKIAALEAAVAGAEAKRREIHNQLVELKGNVSRGWGGGGEPGWPVAGRVCMCGAGGGRVEGRERWQQQQGSGMLGGAIDVGGPSRRGVCLGAPGEGWSLFTHPKARLT